MHDFLLAKEIFDELGRIAKEKKLEQIKSVNLEIGQIFLAHDGHPEHTEDISEENLKFGLESMAKNTPFKDTLFKIKKVAGDDWKIAEVEV